ncbi:glycerol uptake facilitator protein-like 6 [Bolinopsis microptera]|uniref:glycerol uptake facilitator protein-like 6 n=1 Tax=Bolinopsis microptera TaxID=2820187 RepID=UPI00307A631D
MDSNDGDEFGLNYEKYYGQSSIFSARFALGIFTEFIGTFIINYVGLLACLLHATDQLDVNALVVGCAFGGSYLFVSKIFRKIGSCHFNPMLSLCSLFFGNLSILYCFLSFLAQIAAVSLATSVLTSLHREYDILYATVFKPEGISTMAMLVAEFSGSLLVISSRLVTTDKANLDNYYTSLSMVLSITVFIPYSGGAINPARAIGASLFTLQEVPDYYWIYWCGPLLASFITIILLSLSSDILVWPTGGLLYYNPTTVFIFRYIGVAHWGPPLLQSYYCLLAYFARKTQLQTKSTSGFRDNGDFLHSVIS